MNILPSLYVNLVWQRPRTIGISFAWLGFTFAVLIGSNH